MNIKGFEVKFQARSSAELTKMYEARMKNDNPLKNRKISTSNTRAKEYTSMQEQKKTSASKQVDNQQKLTTSTSIEQPIEKQEQRKTKGEQTRNSTHTVGSSQMLNKNEDQRKQHVATGNSIQAIGSSQSQNKKQDQRKKTMNIGNSSQTMGSNEMQNKNVDQRKHSLTGTRSAVRIETSKEIPVQNKDFCAKSYHKRQFMDTMGNQVQGSMNEQVSKKKKTTLKCPPMSLGDFLNKNKEQVEEELENEEVLEHEEGEENDDLQEVDGDINYPNEEGDSTNQGETSKRKRGKTKCLEAHARSLEDRIEIIFDEYGVSIGPNQSTIVKFSNFLGTVARSSDFCPLVYTNWKSVPDKELIWTYVKQKYIIPDIGKKYVFAILNDAWRRHKCAIKEEHFSKYKSTSERLKNRPKDIPESHFKELIRYWSLGTIQEMSEQNAKNRAQQKWRHRTGPVNFGVIRERLRATKVNKEPPNQAEMFFETRQSKKGEPLDPETTNAMAQLKDLIENSSQQPSEAFHNVFGKEKPGRVRCHGRVTTPTLMKRKEEIAEIEKKHANEMKQLNDKVEEMEQKFQILLRNVINHNNSGLDVDALAAMLSTPGTSTSTHVPNNDEQNQLDDDLLHVDEENEDAY